MVSLSEHLVEAGDHGRLGFHPSCPVCRRDRLFGTLSSEPVVPRRAQALLAGGVLAVSASVPGVSVAQEADHQGEGVAAPDQPGGGELDDPGFDPGGETVLPYETAPVPTTQLGAGEDDVGEGAPLEAEPVEDPDAELVPLSESEAPVTGEEAPVPPAEPVVTPEDQSVTPGEPPPAPGLDAPPPTTREQSTVKEPDRPREQRKTAPKPERSPTGQLPSAPPAPATIPVQEPAVVTQAIAPAADTPDEPIGDGRFHVVAPGDSLWSIAKRLLGPEASMAGIAREVNRLWTLNQDRIGTGDPDLLMVGTRLRLR
jgi:outer membrane biosynthesis protein TonB